MKHPFVWLLMASAAIAQEPSDSVRRAGPGKVEIKSTVIARDGCYSAGKAVAGAPEGATLVENAVLVTFPLEHSNGICTMALHPVEFSITVDALATSKAIIVYVTDKSKNSITAKALALPGRRR